jgi:hypothetical protein
VEVEVAEPGLAQEAETTGQRSPQWFRSVLAVIILGGLAARLAFVTWVRLPRLGFPSDAVYYRIMASNLGKGLGYVVPSLSPRTNL